MAPLKPPVAPDWDGQEIVAEVQLEVQLEVMVGMVLLAAAAAFTTTLTDLAAGVVPEAPEQVRV